jgi:sugar/nucleoside kinase (ribokinase family)
MFVKGLFLGIATLDIAYLVDRVPDPNQKMTARELFVGAGGPATNAAVAFARLGGEAMLATSIGDHALAGAIVADLANLGVRCIDLSHGQKIRPTISSVMITESTGDRAVVSIDDAGIEGNLDELDLSVVDAADIVLLDGRHMEHAIAAAERAHGLGIPVVLDGGSWKPGTERLLPQIACAICSAAFRPPKTSTVREAMDFVSEAGVALIAVTQGSDPILFRNDSADGEVEVPIVNAVDTLGAGDIFHGAFAYHFATGRAFPDALKLAAEIASYSCTGFGTRVWR